MTTLSEIRASQINELLDKVSRRTYQKYLVKVTLRVLRGFADQSVTFDFPVTALIGPNGGGKTTVLGAAGCAYLEIQPRRYFAKSGVFDDAMQDWRIEYELIDRTINAREAIRRTASFLRRKWNRDAPSRDVRVFGVARTVPPSERVEFRKLASNNFSVPADRIENLSSAVADAASKILGKDLSAFRRVRVDSRGQVSMFTGSTSTGIEYSEFHFGAGESSVIRMVTEIESIQESGLVLIEEIENGLHPVATRRMVEYLMDVALRRKAQVVFTTHSQAALDFLPPQAIWAAFNGQVLQGKLDVESLRAITGQVDAKLAIFVEDSFAREWVEMALRLGELPLDAIQVHAVQGDGTAVAANRYHNEDPSRTFNSMAMIDGDSAQAEDATRHVSRLPGGVPERHIFDSVVADLDSAAAKLTAGMHLPIERQATVVRVIRDTGITCRDPHLIFAQVGDKLGLIAESVVRGAFLALWGQIRVEELESVTATVRALLPPDEPE